MPEQGLSRLSEHRHFNDFVRVTFVSSISVRTFCTDFDNRSDTLGFPEGDAPLSHGTHGHVILDFFSNPLPGGIIIRSTFSFYAAFAARA